jgi:putative transport protein
MTDPVSTILRDSPLLTLFLVVGIGYLLGEVSLFGFRLGVAGVLFAGLAVSALRPDLGVPEILGTFGLILFVYSMGLQSGRGCFRSFRDRGAKYSLFTAGVLLLGGGVLLLVARWLNLSSERAAGLFTGATTNTPALAVVLQAARSSVPAETYSIAYPFGVIGILCCFHLARVICKPGPAPDLTETPIQSRNFSVRNPGIAGKTVKEIDALYPNSGFRISRVQHGGTTEVAGGATRLDAEDVVVAVGDEDGLRRAEAVFGTSTATRVEQDRSDIDYRRITISNKAVVGKRIGDLDLSADCQCSITRLRRGDEDFIPTSDTRLNFGDRIRVVAKSEQLGQLSRYFGDSIRGTAELDFASVGIGLVLGVLVGMIPVPVGGLGAFRLGFAGGPLLVALLLGHWGRTGPFNWTIPVSANLTLRQVGLLLFLATVGLRSGPGFVNTFQKNGPLLLLGGALVTLSVTVPALAFGYKVLRIPFDELLGIVSGIHTESAAVAFASHLTRSERTDVGYASVYPAAMIVKVLIAQFILGLGVH